MLRMIASLLLLGWVVAWSASAQPLTSAPTGAPTGAQASTKRSLFLYDFARSKAVPAEGQLQPNRIYVKFESYWKQWVYVRTDDAAMLTDPTEALLPGTVVLPPMIGAAGNRNYRLTAEGTWIRTVEPEQYWYRVKNALPTVKLLAAAEAPKKSHRKLRASP